MQAIQRQVGKRIRELREKKGVSQEALAAACNLHRTYIGLIERGERNLSLTTVETIAREIGVEVAELFVGAEQTEPRRRRPLAKPSGTTREIVAEIAAIRQILIDAKLTDVRRYEALYKSNRKNPEI